MGKSINIILLLHFSIFVLFLKSRKNLLFFLIIKLFYLILAINCYRSTVLLLQSGPRFLKQLLDKIHKSFEIQFEASRMPRISIVSNLNSTTQKPLKYTKISTFVIGSVGHIGSPFWILENIPQIRSQWPKKSFDLATIQS